MDTTLIFAGTAVVMFLFGYITHWIVSSDERSRLKQFERHYKETVALDQERAYLQQPRRRQSRRGRR